MDITMITTEDLNFKSLFCSPLTGFYLRVSIESYVNGHLRYCWLDCYEQPDRDGTFRDWDNEFHNPPFIQPVLVFLYKDFID